MGAGRAAGCGGPHAGANNHRTVCASSQVATALRQRYGRDKVTVVVSRSDRLADIAHEDVERAVGSPVKFTVPSDYRRALLAMHKGRPLALDNHNQLSASFTALARDLAGLETKKAERATSGFKGLLSGRR